MNEIITATRDTEGRRVERINYLMLGITLFIALTTSKLVSDLIEWKVATVYLEIAAQELQKKIKAEEKIAAQRLEAEAKNRAARNAEIARQQEQYQAEQNRINEANQRKRESDQEAQKKRMETCKFWMNEYQNTKLTNDKIHRDNACKDAGMTFN